MGTVHRRGASQTEHRSYSAKLQKVHLRHGHEELVEAAVFAPVASFLSSAAPFLLNAGPVSFSFPFCLETFLCLDTDEDEADEDEADEEIPLLELLLDGVFLEPQALHWRSASVLWSVQALQDQMLTT